MLTGRPRKKKIVQGQPRIDNFMPRGSAGELEEVVMPLEAYESLRLADHLNLSQKKAAEMMGISQQSFSRIVRGARSVVADAIVNAKVIKIEGGDFINKRSMDLMSKLKRKPLLEGFENEIQKHSDTPYKE